MSVVLGKVRSKTIAVKHFYYKSLVFMLARSRDWLMAFIWYRNDQLIELYNLCGFGAFLLKNELVMAIFVSEPRFHAEK